MNRFPLAISYTGDDIDLAARLYDHAVAQGIGCYEFRHTDREKIGYELLARHLEVYQKAFVIIYLLREGSFVRKYSQLELAISDRRTSSNSLALIMDTASEALAIRLYPNIFRMEYRAAREAELFGNVLERVRLNMLQGDEIAGRLQ